MLGRREHTHTQELNLYERIYLDSSPLETDSFNKNTSWSSLIIHHLTATSSINERAICSTYLCVRTALQYSLKHLQHLPQPVCLLFFVFLLSSQCHHTQQPELLIGCLDEKLINIWGLLYHLHFTQSVIVIILSLLRLGGRGEHTHAPTL